MTKTPLVLVADNQNHEIRQMRPDGRRTTVLTQCGKVIAGPFNGEPAAEDCPTCAKVK